MRIMVHCALVPGQIQPRVMHLNNWVSRGVNVASGNTHLVALCMSLMRRPPPGSNGVLRERQDRYADSWNRNVGRACPENIVHEGALVT